MENRKTSTYFFYFDAELIPYTMVYTSLMNPEMLSSRMLRLESSSIYYSSKTFANVRLRPPSYHPQQQQQLQKSSSPPTSMVRTYSSCLLGSGSARNITSTALRIKGYSPCSVRTISTLFSSINVSNKYPPLFFVSDGIRLRTSSSSLSSLSSNHQPVRTVTSMSDANSNRTVTSDSSSSSSSTTGKMTNLVSLGIAITIGIVIYSLNTRIIIDNKPSSSIQHRNTIYTPLSDEIVQLLKDAHTLQTQHKAPLSAAKKYETVYKQLSLPSANTDPFHLLDILLWLSNAQEEGKQYNKAYETLCTAKTLITDIILKMNIPIIPNENTQLTDTVQDGKDSKDTLSLIIASALATDTSPSVEYERLQRRNFYRKTAILFSRLSDLEHYRTVTAATTGNEVNKLAVDDNAIFYAYLGTLLIQSHNPLLWNRVKEYGQLYSTEDHRLRNQWNQVGYTADTMNKKMKNSADTRIIIDSMTATENLSFYSRYTTTVPALCSLSRVETEEVMEYVTILMKMITNSRNSTSGTGISPITITNRTQSKNFPVYVTQPEYMRYYLRALKLILLQQCETISLSLTSGKQPRKASIPYPTTDLALVLLPYTLPIVSSDNHRPSNNKQTSDNKSTTTVVIPSSSIPVTIPLIQAYLAHQIQHTISSPPNNVSATSTESTSTGIHIPGNEGNIYAGYTANRLVEEYNKVFATSSSSSTRKPSNKSSSIVPSFRNAPVTESKSNNNNNSSSNQGIVPTENVSRADISFLLDNLTIVEEMLNALNENNDTYETRTESSNV